MISRPPPRAPRTFVCGWPDLEIRFVSDRPIAEKLGNVRATMSAAALNSLPDQRMMCTVSAEANRGYSPAESLFEVKRNGLLSGSPPLAETRRTAMLAQSRL